MPDQWRVIPESLRRARLAQLLTTEALAKKSGVSSRSINRYESKEQPVRIDSLDCLAKALNVTVKDIARLRSGPEPTQEASAAPAMTAASLAPRTALETLVDIEHAHKRSAPAPVATKSGRVDVLTARRLQHVFTAFRLHDGERYAIAGRVDTMRGIDANEAKLLGGKTGVAARFHVMMSVAPGHDLGVTVHSATKDHTAALQAMHGEAATMIARVLVLDTDDESVGFTSFITKVTARRRWTLVVEEIVKKGK